MEGIYARESPRLGRAVQVGVAGDRVISVSFPESVPDDAGPDHPLLDRVFDYLDGAEDHFDDVTVALTVPTDQRTVLDAVRNVPYGETVDVARVARLAGLDDEDEDDLHAVREALRANPVPLCIPDHRVSGPGATPPEVAERLRDLEA
ncbi:methylated-DNA--[protein]-cysteine S-methyltransferase [Haloplanus rubicundus]|uniref:Methylated-DNA--[protein]-cysteine S-methyltransferase n=1 Tax=Haloplanus rubicundus TaxID=1547898 RepID=A0A345ECI0_9EURY|nr:MGMT family protein [Haloplanus rubicundus]AXG06483.1 methylated-DNA--[protein]-cysteine S-methyltransferase [Haloplanus rubicundus]AXG09902.1 methylated-DNA--[protein]-cysteine S-methyltransferase [Haloplanus rubicundus]